MVRLMAAKVRLSLDHPLAAGQSVPLSEAQAHYLFSVMRLQPGAEVLGFNGRDGEWLMRIAAAQRRGGTLVAERRTRPPEEPPDLWLLFAPLKKARTDFVVEKAVELGVRRILPVQTDYTNAERIRQDRLQAHATEAAEQCGATMVPEVAALAPLARVLADWHGARRLWFADEERRGAPFAGGDDESGPAAILIGPEGGFSEAERARLIAAPFVLATGLGPRILRAETAAIAAITLWQARFGDWR
jgi:16S rRNA (uracil1498-N3)-methyltransferase